MIIGRDNETTLLNKLLAEKEAAFIATWGRRRVGKTYLIRESFANKKNCIFFHATGLYKQKQQQQLEKFSQSLSEAFFDNTPISTPNSWGDAFKIIHNQITKTSKKTVIFLDELPWMATAKSDLLSTIDYYWNRHWQQLNNVILIICGSSVAWIIKKIIHHKGGLHARVTHKIKLEPFTLAETQSFLRNRKIKLNHQQMTQIYMAIGGIPHYLKNIQPGLTAEQNIQQLLFDNNAPLQNEFELLFSSLFNHSEAYIELVKLIAKQRSGVNKSVLRETCKLSPKGSLLSVRLNDLCLAGFIKEHIPQGKTKGAYYKLIDEFCLFYLRWIEPNKHQDFLPAYWLSQSTQPAYYSWSGYAFEALCMKHLKQITQALKIHTGGTASAWQHLPTKKDPEGAQIDLVINRDDKAITLCEIKFTHSPFTIDKAYARNLLNKLEIFRTVTKTNKQLFIAFISANGLKETMYSEELVSNLVVLEDLFKK